MADQIYNIPLRREIQKAPKYMRANKAIRAIKEFLKKHVKQDVKIGKYLNMKVLERGKCHAPHHVEVRVFSETKGEKDKEETYWKAELVGAPVEKVEIPAEQKEEKTESKNEEKMKELNKESKDLEKSKKAPKLKEGKLSTAPTKNIERQDIVSKDEKPSKERKK